MPSSAAALLLEENDELISEAFKVYVRVRPLNDREIIANDRGKTTTKGLSIVKVQNNIVSVLKI
jgi:hypothetical protein